MQLTIVLRERRPVDGHLVVVLQQMFVIDERLRMLFANSRGEQLLGQDDAGSLPFVSTMTAEADLLETVAGRDDPRVIHGACEAAAKVFEDGWIAGGLRDEVVECLIAAGDDAGGGYVMAKDAAVHYLREECPLRNEFTQKVWNVLLTFESEGLLIACAAAEGDDNSARPRLDARCEDRGHQRGDSRGRSRPRDEAQKFAAGVAP